MAIITSNDFITVANAGITVQSTATGFAKANVMIYNHLKRRWRMDALTKSDSNPVMYFDMSAAQTVAAVVLDDVNFDKVIIVGHGSDLSDDWSGADYTSGAVTISNDAQVNRYKVYIPLTAFNYRWLGIIVPDAASAVGAYTTKWEIGRVGILDSVTTFTKNMARNYQRGAQRKYSEVELKSGHVDRISDGEIGWIGTLNFTHRTTAQEADLTTLNNLDISETLIFYENNSDTSKVYFCLRDDNYVGTMVTNSVVTGNSIRLRERI
jgi:hypothetical protein